MRGAAVEPEGRCRRFEMAASRPTTSCARRSSPTRPPSSARRRRPSPRSQGGGVSKIRPPPRRLLLPPWGTEAFASRGAQIAARRARCHPSTHRLGCPSKTCLSDRRPALSVRRDAPHGRPRYRAQARPQDPRRHGPRPDAARTSATSPGRLRLQRSGVSPEQRPPAPPCARATTPSP
jgi:hypothetical protein